MSFSLVYVASRIWFRFYDFFRRWYVEGSKVIFHRLISTLENLDQTFAVRIQLRYFFQPLYKDYTIVGRILGVIFRSCRIVIGVSIYACVAAVFLLVYLTWVSIPVILAGYIFSLR